MTRARKTGSRFRPSLGLDGSLVALGATAWLAVGCSDSSGKTSDAGGGSDSRANAGGAGSTDDAGFCPPGQANCCVYEDAGDGGGVFRCGANAEPFPSCAAVGHGTASFDAYCASTNGVGSCVFCKDGRAGVACACGGISPDGGVCVGTGSECTGPSQ